VPEAIQRAKAYQQAGVDAMFFSGAQTRREIEEIHAAVDLPLLLGGAGDELHDLDFLSANGVRVALQGHFPFQATVKAVYDTLKALRDGVAPADLKDQLAPPELVGQLTRRGDFNQRIQDFLN
jgi:carboxyvinyl-carboxyphosphonate phosphorylmutase